MMFRCMIGCCLLAWGALAGAEPSLAVTAGAMPYQVYQAGADDTALIAVAGTATEIADGTAVEMRLRGAGAARRRWQPAGDVTEGKWHGSFAEVPVGGPYTLEVRAGEATASVGDLLVGDLWILAGQSNMQGVGNNLDVEPPHKRVHVFAMNDTWRVAEEPLHRLNESPDVVHNPSIENDAERVGLVADVTGWTKGAGLGLAFARTVTEATGRPIGLLACAHGGTSMSQWDPGLRDEGGKSLYGSMYRRVMLAGGQVKGVLWYQGESDANAEAAPLFPERFRNLVAAMRSDFEDPELPFYYVQIGRFVRHTDGVDWNRVQQAQLEAEAQIARSGMVPSVHLPLDDLIHIGTPGLIALGEQMGKRALSEVYGKGEIQSGPRVASMTWHGTAFGPQLHVTFTGVNGKLKADGSVWGFYAVDQDNVSLIYRQELHPTDPYTVVLSFQHQPKTSGMIQYGRGYDPACTLMDSEGFGVPVFGPVALPQ